MRHTSILSILAACLFSILSLTASAANNQFDKIVVFGDSLSDNGNIYELTDKRIPQNPPYFNGRFTNGPVWIELVANALHMDTNSKLQFSDRAYAGAWASDAEEDGVRPLIDFQWEVDEFVAEEIHSNTHLENNLFSIWVGSNDYLDGRKKSTPDTATNNSVFGIENGMETLIQHGAKHFLVFNLPDLGLVPGAIAEGPEFAARLSMLSQLHNLKLTAMLEKLKHKHPTIQIIVFDVVPYFTDMVNNPEKYGFTATNIACYNGDFGSLPGVANHKDKSTTVKKSIKAAYQSLPHTLSTETACANPDNYIFWDHVHPTAMVHRWIADYALEKIKQAS